MLKIKRLLIFYLLLIFCFQITFADVLLEPTLNGNEKFRIGYTEAFNYSSYAAHLYGILVGLQEMGWISSIDGMPYESGGEDSEAMWRWLVNNQPSEFLDFVPEAYYSFNDDELIKEASINSVQGEILDLDLMLTMGTTAGRILTQKEPKVPVLVFSASNAIASEIIESDTDSGKDNVWAHVDTGRYRKQVNVLHDIFKFETLGIVYENSIPGRSYADLINVREVCSELGINLVEKHIIENKNAEEYPRYKEDMSKAFIDIADEVDAFYLTASNLSADELPTLFEPFYEKQIPVFSQLGGEEVEKGALMSTAANFFDIGRYGAQIVVMTFHGENPRYLYATYEEIPLIVLNLNVAKKIGYLPDFEILLIADKLYFDAEK